jgi:acetoin utilization deacetylase AcuC-like enzyme
LFLAITSEKEESSLPLALLLSTTRGLMRRAPTSARPLLIRVLASMQRPSVGGSSSAGALLRLQQPHLSAMAGPAWRRALSASASASSSSGAPDPADDARDLRCLIRVQDAVGGWRRRRSCTSSFPPLEVRHTPGDPFAAAMLAQEDEEEAPLDDAAALLSSRPVAFCTNCCTPLTTSHDTDDPACPNCGHKPSEDAALLGLGSFSRSGRAPSPAAAAAAKAAEALREARQLLALELMQQQQQQRGGHAASMLPSGAPLIAWDEEQQEEEEGEDSPSSSSSPFAAPMARHRAALPPHPDRPERVRAIVTRLRLSGLADLCDRTPTRPATDEELLRVHTPSLVAAVDALGGLAVEGCFLGSDSGGGLNNDSKLDARSELLRSALMSGCLPPEMLGAGPATAAAARFAAGTAAELAARLVGSSSFSSSSVAQPRCALALVRPSGAFASRARAAGGSYFNNAAVAARAAQQRAQVQGHHCPSDPPLPLRVMIVSLGASAAVGTAEVFAGDDTVLCVSLHAAPPPPKRAARQRRRQRDRGSNGGGLFPRAEDDFDQDDEDEEDYEEEEEEDDDALVSSSGAYFPPGTHHLARPHFAGVGRGRGFTVNVAWEAPPAPSLLALHDDDARRQQRRHRRRREKHQGRPVSPPELSTPSPEPAEEEEEDEGGVGASAAALFVGGHRGASSGGTPGDGDYAQAVATLLQPLAAEFRPGIVIVSAGTDVLAPPWVLESPPLPPPQRPAPALSPEGLAFTVAAVCRLAPRSLVLLEDAGGGGAAGLPGGDLRSSAAAFELIARSLVGGGGVAAAAEPASALLSGGGSPLGWASVLRTLRALEGSWACAALPRWLDALGGVAAEDQEAGWSEDEDEDEEEEEGAGGDGFWGDDEDEDEEQEEEQGARAHGEGTYDDDEDEDEEEDDDEVGYVEENDGYEEDEEEEETEEEGGGAPPPPPPRIRLVSSPSDVAAAPSTSS